jgi:hypothetical protein
MLPVVVEVCEFNSRLLKGNSMQLEEGLDGLSPTFHPLQLYVILVNVVKDFWKVALVDLIFSFM